MGGVDGLWNKVCVGAGRRVAIIVNLLSLIGVSDRTTYITQYTQHILHNTHNIYYTIHTQIFVTQGCLAGLWGGCNVC